MPEGFTVGAHHPPRRDRRRAGSRRRCWRRCDAARSPWTSSAPGKRRHVCAAGVRAASSSPISNCVRAAVDTLDAIERLGAELAPAHTRTFWSRPKIPAAIVLPLRSRTGARRLRRSLGQAAEDAVVAPLSHHDDLSQRRPRPPRAARVSKCSFASERRCSPTSIRRATSPRCGRWFSNREPPPTNASPIQITDKWERLGIPLEARRRPRRAASPAAGAPRLVSAARESEYARAHRRAHGVPIEYFDELAPWKEALAAADGRRHARLRRAARRGHDRHAGRRRFSAVARLRAAGRALGAVGRAASHRPCRCGLAGSRRSTRSAQLLALR